MKRGMDTFMALTLVAVGGFLIFYFAIPMAHFSGLNALNTTDAGSVARVVATNQTDSFAFLVGLGGTGWVYFMFVMVLACAFLILYTSMRRR